jgi:hypothetical protein
MNRINIDPVYYLTLAPAAKLAIVRSTNILVKLQTQKDSSVSGYLSVHNDELIVSSFFVRGMFARSILSRYRKECNRSYARFTLDAFNVGYGVVVGSERLTNRAEPAL